MKNTKFDAPNEYAIFLQEVIEVVRSLSVYEFDRKPHDLKENGVIKIIDFPFFSWSEKLKNDFISATTEKLKEKNYSIDFLKELKEQFAYELQRNEMKMGTDVFDNNNYSDIFFIIWRSENINGVRKQMSRKVLIYIDDTIKKLEQIEPAQPQLIIKGSPEPIRKFTALQWSTIFYFIEPDLYGEITLKKDRIHRFRLDFKLSNSKNTLSNYHNEITRVINGDEKNELKQHHINTIKAILPYLEKNYHEAFTNAIEDLSLLQDKLDRK